MYAGKLKGTIVARGGESEPAQRNRLKFCRRPRGERTVAHIRVDSAACVRCVC